MSPRALAASLPKVTKPTLEKRGRAYAALIAEWTAIVGPDLGAVSLPERLGAPAAHAPPGGTLTVRVADASATEIQHLAPQIIARINTVLGVCAVSQLKFIRAPLPGRPNQARPRPPTLTAQQERAIAVAVRDVPDPAVQAALGRLGRAIAADADRPEERQAAGRRETR